MAATANHKVPEAEQHLKSLLPDARLDIAEVEKARADLQLLRSARLPWSGKSAKSEFFLTFTAPASPNGKITKPDQVKFVSGDEALRSYASRLQEATFPVEFPDDTPIKLVRRGVLSCSETTHECRMELMLPEDVRTID